MTAQTLTLTDFLLARIAEDESDARLCAETFPSPWEVADRGWRVRIYAENVPDVGDHADPGDVRASCVMEVEPTHEYNDDRWLSERVQHVANFHPARVLAECEAKRRIVELHPLTADVVPVHTGPQPDVGCETCHTVTAASIDDPDYVEALGPCDTLMALALPYADHPDYREEWRP